LRIFFKKFLNGSEGNFQEKTLSKIFNSILKKRSINFKLILRNFSKVNFKDPQKEKFKYKNLI
jgi:hypothetical protein